MFNKMCSRIYMSLMLTAGMMVLIIVITSIAMMSNMMLDTFDGMAAQKLDKSITRCKNYVNSVMLSGNSLAQDGEIISLLEAKDGRPITSVLNNACDYALTINGITVYGTDGAVYTSSNVAGVPTLSQLAENENLNDFFTLDASEYVSLRTDHISGIYGNSAYDTTLGIVTCCRKVYGANGAVLGYIFIDILPSNLYDFFTYEKDAYFTDSVPYISFGSEFFKYGDNYRYAEDFSKRSFSNFRSSDSNYLIAVSNRNFFGGAIMVAVPMASFRSSLFTIILLMTIGAAAILVFVHFTAAALKNNLNTRMMSLLKKMEEHNENAA